MMCRFTLRVPTRAIDNYQIVASGRSQKARSSKYLVDTEIGAPGSRLAMGIQGHQIVAPRPDRLRQLDRERAYRQWRGDGGNGTAELQAAGELHQHDFRLDHQVPVGRRDDAVLEL